MTAFLSPIAGGGFQAFDNQGNVLAGGQLFTYFAGSTSQQATWTNSTQAVTNANPIVLDSAGRSTNELWLQGGQLYKFVLKDSLGNTLATWDNVPGINDASYAAFSEWVAYGSAPTYVNSTTFTVSGNATATLQVGRRIQFFILTGTFYGTIASSTFNSGPGTTSVVLTLDSTGLDNTLYAFAYSFLSSTNSSIPIGVFAPLASPVFTGHPTAPTQTPLSNDTQLATDAYVDLAVAVEKARALVAEALLAPIASPTFTGDPKAPTASPGDTDTSIANTAYVSAAVLVEMVRALAAEALLAPLASPALTGNPTAPTQTAGNNTTRLATTAFVTGAAFNSALPSQTGNSGKFVTTDGTNASWGLPIPAQSGHAGQFLKTDGTNASWALSNSLTPSSRTANTILAAADTAAQIDYTSGTFSQTYTAAATLGAGWFAWFRNSGSGVITHDPNGSETIGGAATAVQNPGDIWLVTCDGTNFQLFRIAGMNKQVYTSGNNTFTVPPGVEKVYVEIWGPGGGAANAAAGNAGKGGGYSAGWLTTTPNGTLTANVGAGGVGGGAGAGTTTFGSLSCAADSATGGSINVAGGTGAATANFSIGGTAMRGAGLVAANGSGSMSGLQPGGGACTSGSAGNANGGDGMIIVTWV